jgi:hypothetical protein
MWLGFFTKVIDLADTIVFALRKKNNQITFLHVYHHSTILVASYFGDKFVGGGNSFILLLLNSLVHTVMYAYYGLASLGPHMQPYLWWKKYLTQLQLVSFRSYLRIYFVWNFELFYAFEVPIYRCDDSFVCELLDSELRISSRVLVILRYLRPHSSCSVP